jgi:DMSO reductase anchor subunit
MSYQEKNITVQLTSYILILGFYLVSWLQMYQGEGLIPGKVFSLWIIVIVATILINIVASILTHIVLTIVEAIKTRKNPDERFIADERDKMIGLKGMRNSYITFSIGVFLSMLAFVLGQPPLIMFSLIVFFSILAELVGDISQLYFYRRGL